MEGSTNIKNVYIQPVAILSEFTKVFEQHNLKMDPQPPCNEETKEVDNHIKLFLGGIPFSTTDEEVQD